MADTTIGMELTPEAEAFIEEWNSPLPYVTAHTSGSTGSPKEVRLLKEDMCASARATLKFFGISEDSQLLLPLSPSYIAGKMQIVRAMVGGCKLWIETPSLTPFADRRFEEVSSSSMAAIVPSQIEGLIRSPAFRKIGAIIIGGAPIPTSLEEVLVRSGVNAWATYGMTETCSHVALRRLGHEEFTPLAGFRFSTDEKGCLVIDTETLSFKRLVTNDMVELCEDGGFIFKGRFDNVINSGGIKIHPEEIERKALKNIPEGFAAYITSRPSSVWGEEMVAVTDWIGLTMDSFEMLPSRLRPKDIIYQKCLERTSSGKIIRKKLR
ncbi:MAG: AMP-binding protein [Muribaculaceae bacterium]|nr:AMP-binding protein [Muribaculaceae bacterium]